METPPRDVPFSFWLLLYKSLFRLVLSTIRLFGAPEFSYSMPHSHH